MVRLATTPRLKAMPAETKAIFRRARGRLLRVSDFERNGLAELYVARFETIYVEPGHLSVVRRGRPSRAQRFGWSGRAI